MWESFNLFQQIFFCIGSVSALVLAIQTILVLILGGGDGGGDVELPDDIGTGMTSEMGDNGVGLVSVRGIFALLASAGFAGVWLGGIEKMHWVLAGVLSILIGFGVMVAVYFVTRALFKLQDQGNLDYKNAIGHSAKVYIPIPPERSGIGKVTLNMQDRFVEVDAVTDAPEKLTTDMLVKVTDILDENTVIVAVE